MSNKKHMVLRHLARTWGLEVPTQAPGRWSHIRSILLGIRGSSVCRIVLMDEDESSKGAPGGASALRSNPKTCGDKVRQNGRARSGSGWDALGTEFGLNLPKHQVRPCWVDGRDANTSLFYASSLCGATPTSEPLEGRAETRSTRRKTG